MMPSGTYSSRQEVGEALKCNLTTVSRTLNLAFISPEIIEKLLAGEIPASKVMVLSEWGNRMAFWADQARFSGTA